MNNFVDSDGNAIPDDQLDQAVASGALSVIPGTRVHMLDAAGRPVTVPAEEAGQAIAAGYRPEASAAVQSRQRSKEFGTIGQKAITALEGAARGATFGTYDVAATALGGEDYRKRALARQQENPLTAGGSELVGAIAPALLSGGTSAEASLAAKLATAPTRAASSLGRLVVGGARAESALGRMALRAAETGTAGAFEGMLYGAGSAAGQAALKGDQITAEKVLSGGAHGALIGGLLGAGLGAVSGKLEKGAAQRGDDMLMRRKLDKLDETLRKQGVSDEKIAERVAAETRRLSERSSFLDRVAADQAMAGLKPGPRTLNRHARTPADIDKLVQEAGTDYLNYEIRTGPLAGKRIFHGAKDPVDALDDITHAFQETDDIVRAHKATAAETIAANPELAPDLNQIAAQVTDGLGQVETKKLSKLFEPLKEARAQQFTGARGHELDALEATRQNLMDAAASGGKSPREVQAIRQARLAVDDAMRDVTENALERAGVDTNLFRQESRMHRSLSLVKDAAEELKLAQYASKPGIENSAAGYALAAALSGNFGGALAVGATMFGQNLLKNRASGIVADLANRVARSDIRMQWGAKALAGEGFKHAVRTPVLKTLSGGAAERFYTRLSETAAAPEDYVVAKTAGIAQQYPELAATMQTTIKGDLQYLAENIPQRYSRAGDTITPAATKPVGSKASADAFWQKVHALEDPGYVVDEMLQGIVPMHAIEALKERRPNEWERLRGLVMQECVTRGEELPFKRRITLGVAFDFNSDRSLRPGAFESIQMSFPVPQDKQGRPSPTSATRAQDGTITAMALSGEI